MSSNIRFIDSNIFIYAILKPKRAINEKVTKMKEKAKEVLSRIYKGEGKGHYHNILRYQK
jgi:predicted nucleic acid-binding protein